ncbi:MAG: ATP-binding protein [Saprospiraceae bacterium]
MDRKTTVIGREKEKQVLEEALRTPEAELVAVIGRRRVGKTFIIKQTYAEETIFEITGLQDATSDRQLEHFNFTLSKYNDTGLPLKKAESWLEAFMLLSLLLEKQMQETQKKVVFFDELPWLAKNAPDFLQGLEYFWNSWAVNQPVVVVICGSAASWMIRHLINNTGGLYNRITRRIYMYPFSLKEVQEYLRERKINFSSYEIVQLYMAVGGIPHYLKEIKGDKSVAQNIDDLCFSPSGLLKDEFGLMFLSLFDHAEKHIAIIRALATSKQGLPRHEIVRKAKVSENGNTTLVLEELEQSGFISSYLPYGKIKKNKLYRLTDEYSLFYLQFVENTKHDGIGTWLHISQSQTYKIWAGYAFESICIKHLASLKHALGISGVYTLSSSFYEKGTSEHQGVQIDFLLDRADNIINVFEIKFYNKEYTLTKDQAESLRRKLWAFEAATKTRKRLSLVLVTTFGITTNQHSSGLVEKVLTLDDLFHI